MLTEPCRRGKIGQVGSVNWPALGPTGSTVWSGAYRWSKDGLPLPWWKCDTLEAGQAREVVDDRGLVAGKDHPDRKSTRLNSSHVKTSYAVFCLNCCRARRAPLLSLHDALPIYRTGRFCELACAWSDRKHRLERCLPVVERRPPPALVEVRHARGRSGARGSR